MQSHTEYARQVLKEAREACREGDYPLSLEKYEWFFEHALDEDKASLAGVRLSYCLNEWSDLGANYPQAKARLGEKLAECLERFEGTREQERFHEYVAISKYLDRMPDAVTKFIDYHQADRDLAKSIVRFIWEELIASGAWEVCGEYVEDPMQAYGRAIGEYRNFMRFCSSHPEAGGEEFAAQIRRFYLNDVKNLVAVLVNTGRHQDAEKVCRTANFDVEQNQIGIPKFTGAGSGLG